MTHTLVQQIMGSTVVAFELARHLSESGAHVTVYAAHTADPMLGYFHAAGINIVFGSSAERISLKDYDYIWVHSQVIPPSISTELKDGTLPGQTTFIFNHMSSLPQAPDEHPYIHGLEDRLASLSLFVSAETRDALTGWIDSGIPVALFPNPAPSTFSAITRDADRPLKRILIVSNHPPKELLEARDSLRERGYEVTTLGRVGDQYSLVDPEMIAAYDVVVTIGKTVQYCLVSGTPVFVYDHFGGFGYLDDTNIDLAAYHNFSGRGGQKFTGVEIHDRLVSDYFDARRFYLARQQEFADQYSFGRVLGKVLKLAKPREIRPFEPAFGSAHLSAQNFAARYYRSWGHNISLAAASARALTEARDSDERVTRLSRRIANLTDTNARLRFRLDKARSERRQLRYRVSTLERELDDLQKSTALRIGRVLARPVVFIRAITQGARDLLHS